MISLTRTLALLSILSLSSSLKLELLSSKSSFSCHVDDDASPADVELADVKLDVRLAVLMVEGESAARAARETPDATADASTESVNPTLESKTNSNSTEPVDVVALASAPAPSA